MRFPFIAFPSSGFEQVNALQHPGQFGKVHFQGSFSGRGWELFKGAFFQPLIPDYESGSVPEQNLTFIAYFIEEDKQMPAERILEHHVFGQHRKLVETTPHVRRLGINEDLDRGGQGQHSFACLRAERTPAKTWLSTSELIRNVCPEAKASSKLPAFSFGRDTWINGSGGLPSWSAFCDFVNLFLQL